MRRSYHNPDPESIPSDEEIAAMRNVPPRVAGDYLGVSESTIRMSIREFRAPFGCAFRGDGHGWVYSIPGPALVRYKQEGVTTPAWHELRDMIRHEVMTAVREGIRELDAIAKTG